MANAAEQVLSRELRFIGRGGGSRDYIRIIPQQLRDRNAPLIGGRPTALAQHPGSVWIFEAIDRVAEAYVVFPLEVRRLVVIIARSGAVGQDFVEIRIRIVMENRVSPRGVVVLGGPKYLSHQRQRGIGNALVVH